MTNKKTELHLFFPTPIWTNRIENYLEINDKMSKYIHALRDKDLLTLRKSNIGGWVDFIDDAQSDPLPRLARLGVTWGGKIYIFDDLGIGFRSVHEVEDLLVERVDDQLRYQKGLLGDIDFKKYAGRSLCPKVDKSF